MLNKEIIGKRIAFFRREKGITQRELADFLHISYQAVSKWESGKSLPTVEMLYEISNLLNVTADALLNENTWKNREITYRDSGLDTQKLHALKEEIQQFNTEDGNIISANYADAYLFQIDTSRMREPVYSCITCVPGSKEKLAKKYGYNQEICADVAASAMNHILQHGMRPVILKGMIVCGNYSHDQLYLMAQSFQKICEENQVSFAGMEIAAQPVNYGPEDYELSATVVGVQDRDKLLTGNCPREGDVLIGIRTEGIDGTNYPIVKIILDKNPALYHAKIDGSPQGKTVAVVGASGGGKSTLLRLLCGFYRPQQGKFWWRGSVLETGIWRRCDHVFPMCPNMPICFRHPWGKILP